MDVERQQATNAASTMRKQLLSDGLFRLIGERIVSGELAPGTRIRDADLAEELAVSRTPVREALQRLERVGMVTMYPSRYTEVTLVTPESVAAALTFAGLQAGIVARMACPRLEDGDFDAISALISEIGATMDDPVECSRIRRALIAHLAEHTGNHLQQSLIGEANLGMARALREYVIPDEHRPQMLAGCADLDAALRAGDADAAEQACRRLYGVG